MNIDERVQFAILSKYYGKMLTEKQRDIVSMYVDNNLSLSEVSEELGISRQAVKDAIDTSFHALTQIEDKLGFIARDSKIKSIIENKTNGIDKDTKIELISYLEDI